MSQYEAYLVGGEGHGIIIGSDDPLPDTIEYKYIHDKDIYEKTEIFIGLNMWVYKGIDGLQAMNLLLKDAALVRQIKDKVR